MPFPFSFTPSILVFSLFSFILPVSDVFAKTIRVCQSACVFQNIAQAVSQASNYDIIQIEPGVYPVGTLEITKPITLKGVSGQPERVILDGMSKGHILLIKSDDVRIDSLTLQNGGKDDILDLAGIYVEEVKRCRILKNRILNATYGIYLAKSNECKIKENVVQSNAENEVLSGNGIHLWYSHLVHVENNRVSGHRDGLYFEFSYSLNILNNQSVQNIRYGMHFMFCHDSKFKKNLFLHNQTGVAIMYSERIEMLHNRFYRSLQRSSLGILLKEINHSHFRYNFIEDKTEGIFLDSVSYSKFSFNQIKRNGIAIKIYGNCEKNVFSQNNFVDNFFDVSTNTKESNNTFVNNYWNKYKGYDLNKDGYGDVLYRPVHPFVYWTAKIPELAILLNSPIEYFLQFAEKLFPALGPALLYDKAPLIFPVEI